MKLELDSQGLRLLASKPGEVASRLANLRHLRQNCSGTGTQLWSSCFWIQGPSLRAAWQALEGPKMASMHCLHTRVAFVSQRSPALQSDTRQVQDGQRVVTLEGRLLQRKMNLARNINGNYKCYTLDYVTLSNKLTEYDKILKCFTI